MQKTQKGSANEIYKHTKANTQIYLQCLNTGLKKVKTDFIQIFGIYLKSEQLFTSVSYISRQIQRLLITL